MSYLLLSLLAFIATGVAAELISSPSGRVIRPATHKPPPPRKKTMNYVSRFEIGQLVRHVGVPFKVHAVKFSESKVTYDLLFDGDILSDVPSEQVNPVEETPA